MSGTYKCGLKRTRGILLESFFTHSSSPAMRSRLLCFAIRDNYFAEEEQSKLPS